MRLLQVSKKVIHLLESGHQSLSKLNVSDFHERTTPGEWVVIEGINESYLCYINPHANGGVLLKVCGKFKLNPQIAPNEYVVQRLKLAREYRQKVLGRYSNCRLFFGSVDGIPGLTIDSYENLTIIEISTLGCWNLRQEIRAWCENELLSTNILMRNKSTQWEELPRHDEAVAIKRICIVDNNIKAQIELDKIQKIGYYYDHSRNRNKLENLIHTFSKNGSHYENALDLFCYIGSWGLTLLQSGLKKVDFVDQGDFESCITENIKLNSLTNEGKFYRSDVFGFLEQAFREQRNYDIIISDPPAMTKRADQKAQALRGYSKIHLACLKLAKKGTIFVAASCTSYITNEELDQTVVVSAQKILREVRLLDIGTQEWDHPIRGLKVEENYIKYLCYIVL